MKKHLLLILVLIHAAAAHGERLKDIVDIQGVRSNPLTGVGLVVGLANTGDKTLASQRILTNILRSSGLVLSPTDFTGGNIAVVMVTAELGPFAREGSRIDIDVSSIGDAESLQGGMLLPTPLKGFDGQVYAEGHGAVFIGGWSASGKQASVTKNHPTVGRIPGGAIVEREEIATFIHDVGRDRVVTFNLRNNDFSTANRISTEINKIYADIATVVDAGTIQVTVPEAIDRSEVAGFIDTITAVEVKVDVPAVVVINERTGTIVVGENVGISEVAISQGGLVVKIRETETVSQPLAPFSRGATTEKVPETLMAVEEEEGYLIPVPRVVTVAELARALNAIGATPQDLIAIFNALKKAGALQARLEIM